MTTGDPARREPDLQGRVSELAALEHAVARLDGCRRSRWLAVCGEPGIGKTRMLTELCRHADACGHLVLDGHGVDLERDLPFGVLVDALDDYLGSLEPRRLSVLGRERLAELTAVFPALAAMDLGPRTPPAAAVAPAERYRTHRAIRALLERLAGPRPLVLALDDLHWADAATVELVAFLLRRPPAARVLLALAARTATMPPVLATALATADRDDGRARDGHRLELEPLPAGAAHALLAEHFRLDPDGRAAVYRASGGNPFYLLQLGRSGADRGGPRDGTGLPGVPPVVAAATAEEIAERTPAARHVAQAAAVVGEQFAPELVAAAAELGHDVVLAAFDELAAAGLIRPTQLPGRFAFRHPIVRAAVYGSAGAGWLLGAHDRTARALAAAGADVVVRAPHVERSTAGADPAAADLLARAGASSMGRAPADAAHWFAAALRTLPAGTDPARRLELTLDRGRALSAAGRLAEARTVLDAGLAMLPGGDVARRARMLATCAGLDNLLGQPGRARARLLEALGALDDRHRAEAARVRIGLAAGCYYAGDFDEMRRWERDAREDAIALGDPALLAAATGLVAGAEYLTADIGAARAAAAETVRLLDTVDDDALSPHLVALTWFGWTQAHLGDLPGALHGLDRVAAAARASGQAHLVPLVEVGRVYALVWSGRLAEAGRSADTALDASLFSGNTLFLVLATAARSWSALLAGDVHAAVRHGEDAVACAGEDPDVVTATARYALAEARVEAGEPERGRDELLGAAGGPDLPLIERAYRPRWYELLTRAELAVGDLPAATGWAERAGKAADGPVPIPLRAAEAALAGAAVALATADGAATVAARRAGDLADLAGAPLAGARARILAGRALAGEGCTARAVDELGAAEATAAACGARRLRDEAARELRRLGRPVARGGRPRRRTGPAGGVDALSRRERQVAELVADGRTNRQIGRALFVSDRTVETHLAKVFAKLGVSSRAAVAEFVGRVRA